MDRFSDIFKKSFNWAWAHKMLLLVYIPLAIALVTGVYVMIIYMSWLNDREEALDTLMRYKRLIDRTEEMKQGYTYTQADVGLEVGAVDIPTRIYDRKGDVIGEFFEQKREIVPYDFIPDWLIKSVIASEDRDFYNHRGVNPKSIFRAFLTNLRNMRVVQGGSTITQQLAKVLFTDMERSIKRKIYELFCALEIEKRYDKHDIMSMYLNLIYFGNGAYGVESASKMFFGHSVKDSSEVECAMIVATISNPSLYSPLRNLDRSVSKTRRILQSLTDAGFVREREAEYKYDRFLNKWDVEFDESGRAVSSLVGSFLYSSFKVNRAPFFNEYVRRVLVQKFDEQLIKRGGLSVHTTIDGDKQDIALSLMRNAISSQRDYHRDKASAIRYESLAEQEKEKADNIEGAFVSIDPYTGEILAYVGGYAFTATSQHDHVSQIRRQPGSSIKPLVYYAAIEDGFLTPSTVIIDEEKVFDGDYEPSNYDNKFYGPVIARTALARSRNIPAVSVLNRIGYDTVFRVLRNSLGFSSDRMKERFAKTLSFALGTYELSPLESAVIHAVIVNGGHYIQPYGIVSVTDYSGNVLWDNRSNVEQNIRETRRRTGEVLRADAAAVTISMLKGVLEPGGTAYGSTAGRRFDFEIAGKTGTSSNYADAWMMGYTSNSVTSVWIGNRRGSISLGSGRSGGVVAAPVWTEYIRTAYSDDPPPDFPVPFDRTSEETICLESGQVAAPGGACPETADQIFIVRTEPGEYCRIHMPVEVMEPEE